MVSAKVSHPDALVFKSIFEVLSKLVDEANIEVNSSEMVIRASDPAQVAYIEIVHPATAFSTYEVEDSGDFGVIVSTVNKIMKAAKRGHRLDINVSGDEVELTIVGPLKKTYRVRAVAVPKPELSVESLTFDAKATVLVEALRNALKDIELVSDKVYVEQEGGEILRLRGGGETKYTLSLSRSSGAVIDMVGGEKSVSSYNVDYLTNLMPLLKVGDTVTLEFINNGPLKATLEMPIGGRVTFLLAPYLG